MSKVICWRRQHNSSISITKAIKKFYPASTLKFMNKENGTYDKCYVHSLNTFDSIVFND